MWKAIKTSHPWDRTQGARKWDEIMVFILTILTNMLITFIFLNLYSRYLAKELKKIEDRVLVYLQLKTMLQKDSPSSVKE